MKTRSKFNLFYEYSMYIDTPDYLADTIINDVGLELFILEEKYVKTKSNKPYVLVYVKYYKKYHDRFKRFLDILRYNMLMYNNPSYQSDCHELEEEMNNGKLSKGTRN